MVYLLLSTGLPHDELVNLDPAQIAPVSPATWAAAVEDHVSMHSVIEHAGACQGRSSLDLQHLDRRLSAP